MEIAWENEIKFKSVSNIWYLFGLSRVIALKIKHESGRTDVATQRVERVLLMLPKMTLNMTPTTVPERGKSLLSEKLLIHRSPPESKVTSLCRESYQNCYQQYRPIPPLPPASVKLLNNITSKEATELKALASLHGLLRRVRCVTRLKSISLNNIFIYTASSTSK